MDIALIEGWMYDLSQLFLWPVMVAIIALFLYAFFTLGIFAAQFRQRRSGWAGIERALQQGAESALRGYPLLRHRVQWPMLTQTDLEVFASRELEPIRIVTRVAPMLGLVATMIPMGPALKALANGNVQGISENLVVAFTAVIFGLITASLTFWIASVRKQWFLYELRLMPIAGEETVLDSESVQEKPVVAQNPNRRPAE